MGRPPPHAYDNTESAAALATPAKGPESPDKSEYQGVKPQMGSDSYMTTFAKTVSAFTPSRSKGKETSNRPPIEEDPMAA